MLLKRKSEPDADELGDFFAAEADKLPEPVPANVLSMERERERLRAGHEKRQAEKARREILDHCAYCGSSELGKMPPLLREVVSTWIDSKAPNGHFQLTLCRQCIQAHRSVPADFGNFDHHKAIGIALGRSSSPHRGALDHIARDHYATDALNVLSYAAAAWLAQEADEPEPGNGEPWSHLPSRLDWSQ